MLPRSLRLTRKGFEDARGLSRVTTPHFSISHGPAPLEGGSAIIVSKKVVKGAVGRHLLKRRVRAALHRWSRKDYVLIVTARAGAQELSVAEIENELSGVLKAILS